MKLEIDYSAVPSPTVENENQEWEPPVHKYFGKKLPNGKTEREPVYVHQEYPRLMYALQNSKITARIVHSDGERANLGEGWEPTPAAFGYIGAPSFEQNLVLKKASIEDEPAKRGRPAKTE